MISSEKFEEEYEYFIFFNELEKFAKDINFKFATYGNIIETISNLNEFFIKNYPQLKDDKLCSEIFGERMIGYIEEDFYKDIYLLKFITVGLFLIRKLIKNNDLKSDILLNAFNFIREEIFLKIKNNILENKKFNVIMTETIQILEEDKILLDMNEIICEKNRKIFEVEKLNLDLEDKVIEYENENKKLLKENSIVKAEFNTLNEEIKYNFNKKIEEMSFNISNMNKKINEKIEENDLKKISEKFKNDLDALDKKVRRLCIRNNVKWLQDMIFKILQ